MSRTFEIDSDYAARRMSSPRIEATRGPRKDPYVAKVERGVPRGCLLTIHLISRVLVDIMSLIGHEVTGVAADAWLRRYRLGTAAAYRPDGSEVRLDDRRRSRHRRLRRPVGDLRLKKIVASFVFESQTSEHYWTIATDISIGDDKPLVAAHSATACPSQAIASGSHAINSPLSAAVSLAGPSQNESSNGGRVSNLLRAARTGWWRTVCSNFIKSDTALLRAPMAADLPAANRISTATRFPGSRVSNHWMLRIETAPRRGSASL